MSPEDQMKLDKDQKELFEAFEKIIEGQEWRFQPIMEMDMLDVAHASIALHKIIWHRGGQVTYT